ncbi:MAG: hypothetical protein V3S01_10950 [Dehalococcoidia bacterium]
MALDAEDLAAIAKLISAGQAEASKPFLARLDKLEKVETPDVASVVAKALAEAKKVDPKKAEDTKVDPALAAKMAALEAELATQKKATESATAARSTERMLSALRTELAKKDIPAARIDHVVAVLHNAEGRIALNEAGKATIRFDRTTTAGDYTDTPTLDKGLDEWLGTDAGKAFLPAKDVAGSKVHSSRSRPATTPDGKVNPRNLVNTLLGGALRGA